MREKRESYNLEFYWFFFPSSHFSYVSFIQFIEYLHAKVTIKRLQEQVKQYEMKLDDMTATKVAEKEQQLQQEYNRLIQEMKNRF